jgi:hypothetical protein
MNMAEHLAETSIPTLSSESRGNYSTTAKLAGAYLFGNEMLN